MKTTDMFIALTPEAREALLEEGVENSRIRLQPYGVDASHTDPSCDRDPVRQRWGAESDDAVVVLFTGRLLREKGTSRACPGNRRLADPNIRLVCVGSGPEATRHRPRAAAALGFAGLVREPWGRNGAGIPELLASADVFAAAQPADTILGGTAWVRGNRGDGELRTCARGRQRIDSVRARRCRPPCPTCMRIPSSPRRLDSRK